MLMLSVWCWQCGRKNNSQVCRALQLHPGGLKHNTDSQTHTDLTCTSTHSNKTDGISDSQAASRRPEVSTHGFSVGSRWPPQAHGTVGSSSWVLADGDVASRPWRSRWTCWTGLSLWPLGAKAAAALEVKEHRGGKKRGGTGRTLKTWEERWSRRLPGVPGLLSCCRAWTHLLSLYSCISLQSRRDEGESATSAPKA